MAVVCPDAAFAKPGITTLQGGEGKKWAIAQHPG
jgi:hypothetical protein